jgi:hypothetical protein
LSSMHELESHTKRSPKYLRQYWLEMDHPPISRWWCECVDRQSHPQSGGASSWHINRDCLCLCLNSQNPRQRHPKICTW